MAANTDAVCQRKDQSLSRSSISGYGFSPLQTKLSAYVELDAQETACLAELENAPKHMNSGEVLIEENETLGSAGILTSGWCAKYKLLNDGRRQVVSLLLPGSFIGVHANVFDISDHSIETLTACEVAWFDPQRITDIFAQLPRLAATILWDVAREESIIMEHLLSVGRRNAYERLTHLVVEISIMMKRRGLEIKDHQPLPITQSVIADVLGLSQVHVSRTLRRARSEGLIDRTRGGIAIRDLEKLIQVSDYDDTYLHQHSMPKRIRKSLEKNREHRLTTAKGR